MAKYINSDSIIKGMIKYQFESQNSPMTKYDFVDELLCDDVIEVVRCENCKHRVTTAGDLIAPYCEKIVPAILDWLAEQKFIDIVRCKDCKHLKEIDPDNLYVCARIDIGMDGEPSFLSPENDFCSYGERKENE